LRSCYCPTCPDRAYRQRYGYGPRVSRHYRRLQSARSPQVGGDGGGGCCWAATSVALNSTASILSIHRCIVSPLLVTTGRRGGGSHCDTPLSL
jgi:hypothetical protein